MIAWQFYLRKAVNKKKKNFFFFKEVFFRGNFLAVQWLGFLASKGTKIPQAVQHGKKKVGVVCIR